MFGSARRVVLETAELLRPPVRLTVTEAAERHVFVKVPGKYEGPFLSEISPALIEPADCITSRWFNELVYVGSVQTGKTQALVVNPIAHAIKCDMMDVQIVEKDRGTARKFSRLKFDRLLQHSPDLLAQLAPSRNADNTHDKTFKSGIVINIAWPSRNQLAGSSTGRVFNTDYDRFPDDIGGEGSGFSQTGQRTTVFGSKAMNLAESTPSKDVEDPDWEPSTPHEAPPTKGILGLYNSGDRRMLYCQCPSCNEYFRPSVYPEAFFIPEAGDIEERAQGAGLICTGCGYIIDQSQEEQIRFGGVWVGEGQSIDSNGVIHGERIKSTRASFWQAGIFASFQTWRGLIRKYLHALDNFERTGDEESLKNVYNQNFAAPYIYQAQKSENHSIDFLKDRAEPLDRYFVPTECRALVAAIDVQGGANARFEVMVLGLGPGDQKWIIDRYAIKKSERIGEDGKPLQMSPGSYIEDWQLITSKVLNATYRIDPDTELNIYRVALDTGGEPGVTKNAYRYWRGLDRSDKKKLMLIKGATAPMAPPVEKRYPDTSKVKDRNSGSAGDVPVYFINNNNMKDRIDGDLHRETEGDGYIHLPLWLKDNHFEELLSEKRLAKGWEKKSGRPNETWILFSYIYGVLFFLGVFKPKFWENPPHWARSFDVNSCVVSKETRIAATKKARGRRTRFVFD